MSYHRILNLSQIKLVSLFDGGQSYLHFLEYPIQLITIVRPAGCACGYNTSVSCSSMKKAILQDSTHNGTLFNHSLIHRIDSIEETLLDFFIFQKADIRDLHCISPGILIDPLNSFVISVHFSQGFFIGGLFSWTAPP